MTSFLCIAVVEQLQNSVVSLTARVSTLEKCCSQPSSCLATQSSAPASTAATNKESEAADDEDDFELFGSDDEVIFAAFSFFWSLKLITGAFSCHISFPVKNEPFVVFFG